MQADDTEPTTIIAIFRPNPRKNAFTPDNVAAKNQWYIINLDEMAESIKLPIDKRMYLERLDTENTEVTSDSIKASVMSPIGRKPRVDIKNNHLEYATIWYASEPVLSRVEDANVVQVISGGDHGRYDPCNESHTYITPNTASDAGEYIPALTVLFYSACISLLFLNSSCLAGFE